MQQTLTIVQPNSLMQDIVIKLSNCQMQTIVGNLNHATHSLAATGDYKTFAHSFRILQLHSNHSQWSLKKGLLSTNFL